MERAKLIHYTHLLEGNSLTFLCDTLGIISLIPVLWHTRKFGAVALTGIIATIIALALNPYATHFFGFTAASMVFDVLARLIGYKSCLEKPIFSIISLLFISTISTAVAGAIIGFIFTNPEFLATTFWRCSLLRSIACCRWHHRRSRWAHVDKSAFNENQHTKGAGVKAMKQKIDSELTNLMEKGAEFHGHLGPFLVLGIRAGLIGLRELGAPRRFGQLNVTAKLKLSVSFSCLIDGI